MKTMRVMMVAGAALAALLLGGCVYYQVGVTAHINAGKQSIQSGEITTVTADAWATDGSPLTYEWTEDGVPLAETSPRLSWSRFVTADTVVTIGLTVRSATGASQTDTRTVSVLASAAPASLVVENDSSYAAYYLYVCATASSDWGPDQLRPSTVIPAHGGSFTLKGVPAGTWDILVEGQNGSPTWKALQTVFSPGQALIIHLS